VLPHRFTPPSRREEKGPVGRRHCTFAAKGWRVRDEARTTRYVSVIHASDA
jgi:hypothetical protein